MKKKNFFILILLLFIGTGAVLYANSDSDPLISKSFFDDAIIQLRGEFDQKINNLSTDSNIQNTVSEGTGNQVVTTKYQAYEFNKDAIVLFGEGTEFILRSGTANLVEPTGNGVPDLTSGENLIDGSPIPQNHLLLSPRNDSRGLKCNEQVWIMIKGKFRVE